MTVNITCHVCDGRRLCEACRNAARALTAAGFQVEHSTRYAALRAAASGTYGFEACIVPVGQNERAVVDAAVALLGARRLALVVDTGSARPAVAPDDVAVVERTAYAGGDFDLAWLTTPKPAADDATRTTVRADFERPTESKIDAAPAAAPHATRRLKRVADGARLSIAQAGLADAPRLDLLAVLEDEIAWSRASGMRFAIVLAHLHGIAAPRGTEQHAAIEARCREMERLIASAVRASDIVCGRGDDFVVALSEADATGARLAAQRVTETIAASRLRPKRKAPQARGFTAWSVGYACYPEDGGTRDALLARATATLAPIGGPPR